MLKIWFLFTLSVTTLLYGSQANATTPPVVAGLVNPESVVAGPDGRIYVSEIGEFGKEKDGRISVMDAAGQARVFASGMDDPKGLAFYGNHLFVADRTRVLRVGLDGQWQVFAAAEAFPAVPQFLNDVEADAHGNLYVSDSGDLKGNHGAIYRIGSNGKVTVVTNQARDDRVQSPNGLLMDGKSSLLMVDFHSGILYRIALRSGEMKKIAEGFGGGDGIVRASKSVLYVSDWKNGAVYAVDSKGKSRLFRGGFQAAADIGLSKDGKYVVVPDMKAGELHWLPVE